MAKNIRRTYDISGSSVTIELEGLIKTVQLSVRRANDEIDRSRGAMHDVFLNVAHAKREGKQSEVVSLVCEAQRNAERLAEAARDSAQALKDWAHLEAALNRKTRLVRPEGFNTEDEDE